MNALNTFVVLIIDSVVCFALGYAFRGFISREMVKAAAEAKRYLAELDGVEDKVDSAVANEVNKL
jgi:hypothetical protein